MSRIHVQIGYDPLDDFGRREVWNNHFRKLQQNHEQGEREIRYEWDAKEYVQRSQEVRNLEWNGREIRNGESSLLLYHLGVLLKYISFPNRRHTGVR
jgi:hypothetical protein